MTRHCRFFGSYWWSEIFLKSILMNFSGVGEGFLLWVGMMGSGLQKKRSTCSWIFCAAGCPGVTASGLIPSKGTHFPCRNNVNMISLGHKNVDIHSILFCIWFLWDFNEDEKSQIWKWFLNRVQARSLLIWILIHGLKWNQSVKYAF